MIRLWYTVALKKRSVRLRWLGKQWGCLNLRQEIQYWKLPTKSWLRNWKWLLVISTATTSQVTSMVLDSLLVKILTFLISRLTKVSAVMNFNLLQKSLTLRSILKSFKRLTVSTPRASQTLCSIPALKGHTQWNSFSTQIWRSSGGSSNMAKKPTSQSCSSCGPRCSWANMLQNFSRHWEIITICSIFTTVKMRTKPRDTSTLNRCQRSYHISTLSTLKVKSNCREGRGLKD